MENKKISLEYMEKVFSELFYGKNPETAIPDLKKKVLDGYWYRIGTKLHSFTGKGGVLQYIDTCVEQSLPYFGIVDNISVFIDGEYYSLDELNVKEGLYEKR